MDNEDTFISWTKLRNQGKQKYVADYITNLRGFVRFDSISVDVVTHVFEDYYLNNPRISSLYLNHKKQKSLCGGLKNTKSKIKNSNWVFQSDDKSYRDDYYENIYRVTNFNESGENLTGLRIGIVDYNAQNSFKSSVRNENSYIYETLWYKKEPEITLWTNGHASQYGRPITKNSDLFLTLDMNKRSIIWKDVFNKQYCPTKQKIPRNVRIIIETLGDVKVKQINN
ncbi:hypothetical protein M0812_25834 [Anaeramoeba flamelloides]|uniref:Uncharacterized protein n=1 Tax=Anaeramoeba flamelloides TaxID=1746091 RepID=A0AAV7YEG8_9EUKA|nr:hypothetical protein M0812_25834 [Anaeramoeba flamelloides]